MRKCLAVMSALLMVLATTSRAEAQVWVSAGLQTNPLANAILADATLVGDSARHWTAVCSSSVTAVVFVEHRDAANVTTLHAQGFFVPASGTVSVGPASTLVILDSEHMRIRLNGAIIGSVWCSIFSD